MKKIDEEDFLWERERVREEKSEGKGGIKQEPKTEEWIWTVDLWE
jgi:hypothetical protein